MSIVQLPDCILRHVLLFLLPDAGTRVVRYQTFEQMRQAYSAVVQPLQLTCRRFHAALGVADRLLVVRAFEPPCASTAMAAVLGATGGRDLNERLRLLRRRVHRAQSRIPDGVRNELSSRTIYRCFGSRFAEFAAAKATWHRHVWNRYRRGWAATLNEVVWLYLQFQDVVEAAKSDRVASVHAELARLVPRMPLDMAQATPAYHSITNATGPIDSPGGIFAVAAQVMQKFYIGSIATMQQRHRVLRTRIHDVGGECREPCAVAWDHREVFQFTPDEWRTHPASEREHARWARLTREAVACLRRHVVAQASTMAVPWEFAMAACQHLPDLLQGRLPRVVWRRWPAAVRTAWWYSNGDGLLRRTYPAMKLKWARSTAPYDAGRAHAQAHDVAWDPGDGAAWALHVATAVVEAVYLHPLHQHVHHLQVLEHRHHHLAAGPPTGLPPTGQGLPTWDPAEVLQAPPHAWRRTNDMYNATVAQYRRRIQATVAALARTLSIRVGMTRDEQDMVASRGMFLNPCDPAHAFDVHAWTRQAQSHCRDLPRWRMIGEINKLLASCPGSALSIVVDASRASVDTVRGILADLRRHHAQLYQDMSIRFARAVLAYGHQPGNFEARLGPVLQRYDVLRHDIATDYCLLARCHPPEDLPMEVLRSGQPVALHAFSCPGHQQARRHLLQAEMEAAGLPAAGAHDVVQQFVQGSVRRPVGLVVAIAISAECLMLHGRESYLRHYHQCAAFAATAFRPPHTRASMAKYWALVLDHAKLSAQSQEPCLAGSWF